MQTYAWWSLAAAQGEKKASKNKDVIRKRMTPAQINEGEELREKLCAKIPNCAK